MTFFNQFWNFFPAKPINASGSVPLHDEAKMCYHKLLPRSAADLLLKCSHTNKELFFCSQKFGKLHVLGAIHPGLAHYFWEAG